MSSHGKVLDLLDDRYLKLVQDVTGNIEPLPSLYPYEEYAECVIVYQMDTNHEIFMGLIQDFANRSAQESKRELWFWCVQWDVDSTSSAPPVSKKLRVEGAMAPPPAPQPPRPAYTVFERRFLSAELYKEEDLLRLLIDIVQAPSSKVPNFIEFLYTYIDYYEGDGKALVAALRREIPSLWDFERHPQLLNGTLNQKLKDAKDGKPDQSDDKDKDFGSAIRDLDKSVRMKPDLAALERRAEESERMQYREVKFGLQPKTGDEPLPPLFNVPVEPDKRRRFYAACFKSRQRAIFLLTEAGISMDKIRNYRMLQEAHPKDTPELGNGNGLQHYFKDQPWASRDKAEKNRMAALQDKYTEISISNRLAREAEIAAHSAATRNSQSGVGTPASTQLSLPPPLIPSTPLYTAPLPLHRPDRVDEIYAKTHTRSKKKEPAIPLQSFPKPIRKNLKSKLAAHAREAAEAGDDASDSDESVDSIDSMQYEYSGDDIDPDERDDSDDDDAPDHPTGGPSIIAPQVATDLAVPHPPTLPQQAPSTPDIPSLLRNLNLTEWHRLLPVLNGTRPQQALEGHSAAPRDGVQPSASGSSASASGRPPFAPPATMLNQASAAPYGPSQLPRPPAQLYGNTVAGGSQPQTSLPIRTPPPMRVPLADGANRSNIVRYPSANQFAGGYFANLPAAAIASSNNNNHASMPIGDVYRPVNLETLALGQQAYGSGGTPATTQAPGQIGPPPPLQAPPTMTLAQYRQQQASSREALDRAIGSASQESQRPSILAEWQRTMAAQGLLGSTQRPLGSMQAPGYTAPAPPIPPRERPLSFDEWQRRQDGEDALDSTQAPEDAGSAAPNPSRERPIPFAEWQQRQAAVNPTELTMSFANRLSPALVGRWQQPAFPPHQVSVLLQHDVEWAPRAPQINVSAPPPTQPPNIPRGKAPAPQPKVSPFAESPHGIPIQIYFPRVHILDGSSTPTDALLLGYTRPGSGKIVLSKAVFLPVSVWQNTLRRVRVGAYTVLESYPAPQNHPLMQHMVHQRLRPPMQHKAHANNVHKHVYDKLAQAYAIMANSADREDELTKRWRVTPGPMTARERGAVWEGWGAWVDREINMSREERRDAFNADREEVLRVEGESDDEETKLDKMRAKEIEELLDAEDWTSDEDMGDSD
ncbi:hypothetical protein BDV95DRAFT_606041 [Massariosphaeria phaeospora]|uniref:Uncharacterized protein n=1 Tax=Massariosphaeria phaeospora TaxID=100035 RepID=A0A7C8MQB4_9PLEO|nr:hypothetical protein BDV95DRAFT_606041 [Massariosphaeria phaeospora]